VDLEDRVRAKLAARLAPRGAQAALVMRLTTHSQAWLSRYLSGELRMDLPTLEEIATIWRIPVTALVDDNPLPALAPVEEEAQAIAALWPRVPAPIRDSLRGLIELEAGAARGSSKPRESRTSTAPASPAADHRASGRRRAR